MLSDETLANDFEAPLIESQTGTELINNGEGWVIGVRGEQLLRLPTEKHMVTIASTGGGKGTSVAIPNLLTHEGSVFSIEIGGATYQETWRFRKHVLEQEIYVIDPFECTSEPSASINLLETLDPEAPDFYTDAVNFAESMLKSPSGKTPKEPFWEEAPLKLLSALLIYVRTSPDVFEDNRNMVQVVKLMSKYGSKAWRDLMEDFAQDSGPYHSVLNEAGNLLSGDTNITRDSIVMSVSNAFKSFHDSRIAEISSKTSFSLADLRNKKCTLYVIMPETKHYQVHATWLRLLVERAFAACPNYGDAGKNFRHNDRVLFMLDEFTQLGRLDAVDIGMQTARQKGITIWAIFQDLGRLQTVYGDKIASSLLGSAGVTQVFDIGDPVTAKYVSERIGRKLIYIPGTQYGWSGGESSQEQWSHATTESIAEGISQSATTGETENWSSTVADGTSASETHTTSFGTTNSEGIDTSPRNILGFPTLHYKNGPGMHNFLRAGKRAFTRTLNTGASDSTQSGISHTESQSKGGARNSARTTGSSHTKTEGETDTKGGAKGENSGWQYTLTLTPQVIPGLDPAEVEHALGSGNNQILFIRAKNKVLRLLEQRAHFYGVPRLNRSARGDFSLLPPAMPDPQLQPVASVQFRLITAQMPPIPVSEEYKPLTCILQAALTSPQRASSDPENSRSPGEYSAALREFQKAVSAGGRAKPEHLQENLYSVFISAADAIDEEATRNDTAMERAGRKILEDNRRQANLLEILESKRRETEAKQHQLSEKATRCVALGWNVEQYRKELLAMLSQAEAYFSAGNNYQQYLAILNRIAQSWKGIYAPPRPLPVTGAEETETEISSFHAHLSSPIGIPTFDIPPTATPNFKIALISPFDFSKLEMKTPEIAKRLNHSEVTLANGDIVALRQLQDMICKKSQRRWSLWDLSGFNPQSLLNLRYKRNETMAQLLQHLRNYHTANLSDQKTFLQWTQTGNNRNQKNQGNIAAFSRQLRASQERLKEIEKNTDEYVLRLRQKVLLFEKIENELRNFFRHTHNMIAGYDEWKKLQANEVRFLGSGHNELDGEQVETSSPTRYHQVDPYLDAN